MAKGLLFDFDGTLYGDWRVWISLIEKTLAEFGVLISPHDALEKARLMVEKPSLSKCTLRISDVAANLARDHGVSRDKEVRARFFEKLDARMDLTGPEDNVVELLGAFVAQGFRLGIVTFVRKPRITKRLTFWKLDHYFRSVMTPDDEPDFKPSPRPFLSAMEQLEVQPNQCFVIGDEPVDMIGGKKAKAITIGLPRGFFTKEELEEAGADYIARSLNDLPNTIGSSTI